MQIVLLMQPMLASVSGAHNVSTTKVLLWEEIASYYLVGWLHNTVKDTCL
jgi:hypothetical protein